MRPLRLFLVLLFVSSFALAADTTYYVSASGDDNANGITPSTPWRTIGRVNAQTYHSNDRILFRGGDTFGGTIRFTRDNARGEQQPVVVSSYGIGRATIAAGDEDGIAATNAAGIRISNLRITGTSMNSRIFNRAGIAFRTSGLEGPKNVHIDHVEVSGFSLAGILLQVSVPTNGPGFSDVTIESSVVRDNGYAGIAFYGAELVNAFSTVTIRENEVFNTIGFPAPGGEPVEGSGNGMALSGISSGMVIDNTIRDAGMFSSGSYGLALARSRDLSIVGNEIYGYRTVTPAGGGAIDIEGDVQRILVHGNYTHGNEGAGVRVCACIGRVADVTVAYNISENDAQRHVDGSLTLIAQQIAERVVFANNTVYSSAPTDDNPAAASAVYARSVGESYSRVYFLSNIVVTTNRVGLLQVADSSDIANLRFLGNLWHAQDGIAIFRWAGDAFEGFRAWIDATEQETFEGAVVGGDADPLLTAPGAGGTMFPRALSNLAAYRLRPGSPAIDRGFSASRVGLTLAGLDVDFYESFFQFGPIDIGAHELRNTPAAPSIEGVPWTGPITLAIGETREFDIRWRDPDGTDGSTVTIVEGAPHARIVSTGSGRARLTLTPTQNPGTPIRVRFRVTDVTGLSTEQSLELRVTGPLGAGRRRGVSR